MKALMKDGQYIAFFSSPCNPIAIANWCEENLGKLGLNDQWSCSVNNFDGSNIVISGDEDYITFNIVTIKTEF